MAIPTMDEVAKWSAEERLARLDRTADELAAAMAGQPEVMLARRPDAKNWAAKEVVCHLRDVEALFMERFQMIAAMDEPKLTGPDPDRAATERQYIRNDVAEALAHFRRRREETVGYLRALPAAGWQRGAIHPVRGRFTMNDFLTLLAWHDGNHLDQLERALRGQA
jgi:DinB family protein